MMTKIPERPHNKFQRPCTDNDMDNGCNCEIHPLATEGIFQIKPFNTISKIVFRKATYPISYSKLQYWLRYWLKYLNIIIN